MTPFTQLVSDTIKKDEICGVEVGVMEGVNALHLLEEPRIKRLYLVDNYKPYDSQSEIYTQESMDKFYRKAISRMETQFGKTMFIVRDSIWAAKQFPDEFFDFVYIDAGHTYEDIMSDMSVWWAKCKSGGVFGGHDYEYPTVPDIKKAVDEFMTQKGLPLEKICIGRRDGEALEWAVIKP